MKEKANDTSANISPIFTGDYRRDTAVSELEKVAEASNAIFNAMKGIKVKLKSRKKNGKKG